MDSSRSPPDRLRFSSLQDRTRSLNSSASSELERQNSIAEEIKQRSFDCHILPIPGSEYSYELYCQDYKDRQDRQDDPSCLDCDDLQDDSLCQYCKHEQDDPSDYYPGEPVFSSFLAVIRANEEMLNLPSAGTKVLMKFNLKVDDRPRREKPIDDRVRELMSREISRKVDAAAWRAEIASGYAPYRGTEYWRGEEISEEDEAAIFSRYTEHHNQSFIREISPYIRFREKENESAADFKTRANSQTVAFANQCIHRVSEESHADCLDRIVEALRAFGDDLIPNPGEKVWEFHGEVIENPPGLDLPLKVVAFRMNEHRPWIYYDSSRPPKLLYHPIELQKGDFKNILQQLWELDTRDTRCLMTWDAGSTTADVASQIVKDLNKTKPDFWLYTTAFSSRLKPPPLDLHQLYPQIAALYRGATGRYKDCLRKLKATSGGLQHVLGKEGSGKSYFTMQIGRCVAHTPLDDEVVKQSEADKERMAAAILIDERFANPVHPVRRDQKEWDGFLVTVRTIVVNCATNSQCSDWAQKLTELEPDLTVVRLYGYKKELDNLLQPETCSPSIYFDEEDDLTSHIKESLHNSWVWANPAADPLSASEQVKARVAAGTHRDKKQAGWYEHITEALALSHYGPYYRPDDDYRELEDKRYRKAQVRIALLDYIVNACFIVCTPHVIKTMARHFPDAFKPSLLIVDDAHSLTEQIVFASKSVWPDVPTIIAGDPEKSHPTCTNQGRAPYLVCVQACMDHILLREDFRDEDKLIEEEW